MGGYSALAIDLLSKEGGTGSFADGSTLKGSKVLGIYAELDARANATRAAAGATLRAARRPHRLPTFPDADHGFFNGTRRPVRQAGGRRGVRAPPRLLQAPLVGAERRVAA
jgi:dienelactone hydrolase